MAAGVTIYHNPKCSTSRKVLGMIRDAGVEPLVIEYLKTPLSKAELRGLLGRMGIGPRALLRRRGTPYDELGLDDPGKSDDALVDAIVAHPVLMERPVVTSARGAVLCRPVERLRDVLP